MIPAVAIWFFVLSFPVLLEKPVSARIETTSAEHCHRVRKLLMRQLEDHRSNATVSLCTLAAPTVVPE
jgi:hypothetical protein